MSAPKKVCIVGSGNWGSVIAKIVGLNAVSNSNIANEVPMYVYEEMVDGKKLTEIINTRHENVKYLPGHQIPENVTAIADVVEAAKDADILIFVLPHQFVRGVCKQLAGKIKKDAVALSLIKGLDISDKGLDLISNVIRSMLGIECAVLMGANIASEVAIENYCEATIGCKDPDTGRLMKDIMQTPYFRIVVVGDEETVELCGALKNIVATGAGFVDGLGYKGNTKAAVIRLGLMEIIKFAEMMFKRCGGACILDRRWFKLDCQYKSRNSSTGLGRDDQVLQIAQPKYFLKVGDLDDTANNRCSLIHEIFGNCSSVVGTRRVGDDGFNSLKRKVKCTTIEQLEEEMLNGQKLQGPPTAAEVNAMLREKKMEDKFPLFTAIHRICTGEIPPAAFIDCLKNHPEHM